ncbi:unnamed protein product [Trichobilharzia regenti]|nr:unnamed protein product [Trichobilharzia regenti]
MDTGHAQQEFMYLGYPFISTTHSITMNSLPRQQVATTYSSSKKTSYPENQNPYGPLDLIRTYDVLNPNVMSHVAPTVSEETENTVANTKKTNAKVISCFVVVLCLHFF